MLRPLALTILALAVLAVQFVTHRTAIPTALKIKPSAAVNPTHTALYFTLNGLSRRSYSIVLNLQDATLFGSIVEFEDDMPFRYMLTAPIKLPAKELAEVAEVVSRIESKKAGADRVDGGPIGCGDNLELCSALRGESPERNPIECFPLKLEVADFRKVEQLFMGFSPLRERVEWDGHEYRAYPRELEARS